MKLTGYVLASLLCAAPWSISLAHEGASSVQVQSLLKADKSWDGTPYLAYPAGQPELSVVKITIPPHSSLPWHQHQAPNAAYVLTGELTVEKKADGQKRILKQGEVLPEMVDQTHRGTSGAEPVELIVFYAGKADAPLSTPE